MPVIFAVIFALLATLFFGHAQAASRQQFTVAIPNGDILIESFASDTDESRPAVVILSGSKGFTSPVYEELAQHFHAAGLDAYLVHVLSPADLGAIASAGNARARIGYYAERLSDWITSVRGVVSYLNSQPRYAGKVGVLGISLGAQIAAAASAERTDIGALVLVDGAFPNGYSRPVRSLPPLHLVWGSADQVFPVSTGRELVQMAQGLGGSASLDVYRGGAHDFFVKSGRQATSAHRSVSSFFASQLSR